MNLRRYLDLARHRQPFASRASLEATALDLRRELDEVRSSLDGLRADLGALRADVEGVRRQMAAVDARVDTEARTAWNELAARTESWGAHLLDLERRLAPGGDASDEVATGGHRPA